MWVNHEKFRRLSPAKWIENYNEKFTFYPKIVFIQNVYGLGVSPIKISGDQNRVLWFYYADT